MGVSDHKFQKGFSDTNPGARVTGTQQDQVDGLILIALDAGQESGSDRSVACCMAELTRLEEFLQPRQTSTSCAPP